MKSLKTKDIVCAIHLGNNNRTINSIHFIHFLSQTAVPRLYKFNLSVWEKERGSNKWEKRGGCNKLKGCLVCVMFGCQGITQWTGNIMWVTSSFSKDQHDKTLLLYKHKTPTRKHWLSHLNIREQQAFWISNRRLQNSVRTRQYSWIHMKWKLS